MRPVIEHMEVTGTIGEASDRLVAWLVGRAYESDGRRFMTAGRIARPSEEVMTDHIIFDDHRVSGPNAPASPPSPIDALLYAREFEVLLELGRAKGYLEQDDLMSVLRSVELSPDLIIDVVMRVRAEGVEFVDSPDDAGDLISVPPTTAVLDLGTESDGPTAKGVGHQNGAGVQENGTGPATTVLSPGGGGTGAASAPAPGRPPARKPNAAAIEGSAIEPVFDRRTC